MEEKKIIVIIVVATCTILLGFVYLIGNFEIDDEQIVVEENSVIEHNEAIENEVSKEEDKTIFVDISGAVINPGVFEVDQGTRVFEVIEKSGGLKENADTSYLNQAEIVSDQQKIHIYTVEEVENGAIIMQEEILSGSNGYLNGKININTASKEQLMNLSGIGESKATSIIKYREEQGDFNSIEEIMNIPGIKEGVFNKIKDDIVAK